MRILPLIAVLATLAAVAPPAGAKTTVTIGDSDRIAASLGDYLSARYAASDHDYAEAARLFKASLKRDPENPQLLTYAYFTAVCAGNMDDAAKFAERLTAIEPEDRTARLTLAVVAMQKKDFKKARDEINKSSKIPYVTFTASLIDGWAAAGMGNMDAAKASFKLLHAQKSADGLAYFNEALLAEMTGDKQTAEAAYRLALEIGGPMPRVIDAYGRFMERNGRGADAKALYEKVSVDSGFGIVIEPGLARIAAGTIPGPFAPRAQDGAAEALFNIATSLSDDASRDHSVLYLRLALYLNPRLDIATILLANRFEALGKFDDAIAAYRTIPEDSQFYRVAAVASAIDLARLDKNSEAIAELETLAKRHDGDADTLTALGNAYRVAKRYGDAVNAFDRAIAVSGPVTRKNWTLLFSRAVAEQEAGNWPKAEADLKAALVVNPNEPQVLNFLGYSWVDQKRNIQEALVMLEKARALSPQDGYIIDSVGWAYYRLGRFEDAVNALEDAVLLVPGDPTINDHLGDAYWKIGRKRDAQFQWSHALAFGPEPDEKTKIEKKLQTGQP